MASIADCAPRTIGGTSASGVLPEALGGWQSLHDAGRSAALRTREDLQALRAIVAEHEQVVGLGKAEWAACLKTTNLLRCQDGPALGSSKTPGVHAMRLTGA